MSDTIQFARGPLTLEEALTLSEGEPFAATCVGSGFISSPASPALSFASGGSLEAETYTVVITYVNGSGETTASVQSVLSVPANNLLFVTTPGSPSIGTPTGWNVYATTTNNGTLYLQNSTPLSLSANWTEPSSGLLTSGNQPPTNNTTATTYDLMLLFVGGHGTAGNLLVGGGFQTTSGEPSFTAPAGAAMYDPTAKLLWISNGDGTWTSK